MCRRPVFLASLAFACAASPQRRPGEGNQAVSRPDSADASPPAKDPRDVPTAQSVPTVEADPAREAATQRAVAIVRWTAYKKALTLSRSSSCADDWRPLRSAYIELHDHESSEERDAAITRLESCRKTYAKKARGVAAKELQGSRKDFGIALEDGFDESNPHRKGALTAKVDGSTLRVRLKGDVEGRARHSQNEVDSWCDLDGATPFSKIVLRGGSGTFSCQPGAWPGSTRNLVDAMDSVVQSGEPFSKDPGRLPSPQPSEGQFDPGDIDPRAKAFRIGVAWCDKYIRNYTRCVLERMPEPAKTQTLKAVIRSVDAWRAAARGPGRAALAPTCESGYASAREVTTAMGCTWE